jgi:hypothetical protein
MSPDTLEGEIVSNVIQNQNLETIPKLYFKFFFHFHQIQLFVSKYNKSYLLSNMKNLSEKYLAMWRSENSILMWGYQCFYA